MIKQKKSYQQLIEEHMDLVPFMVRVLTRSCYLTSDEQEELLQTGYLGLCNAASKYDQTRPFRPYAKTAIRNAIYNYWRNIEKHSKNICSLEKLLEENECTGELLFPDVQVPSPEQEALQQLSTQYLMELELNCSNMLQKGILALRLQQDGYTDQDLAAFYQVPTNHIRAWQSKARKWLRKNDNLYELLAS